MYCNILCELTQHASQELTGGALMFTVFEAERVVQPLVAVTVNVCKDPRLIRELPTLAVTVTWMFSPAPTVA